VTAKCEKDCHFLKSLLRVGCFERKVVTEKPENCLPTRILNWLLLMPSGPFLLLGIQFFQYFEKQKGVTIDVAKT